MEVDANDVLRVNGMAMNKTEFESYTNNLGQNICQPTPVLVVDPEADYDLVAWVLERVYDQRCSSVEILEQNTGG